MNAGLNTHWEPQPAGAAWVTRTLAHYSSANAVLRDFADLLHTTTGTRLADWVDYLHVPTAAGLQAAGFQLAADGWYQHPAALLPPVCVSGRSIVALRVDSVSDFAVACSHRFPIEVLGQAGDLLRQAWITTAESSTVSFGVIEHRGCSIRRPPSQLSDQQKQQIHQTADQLRLRTREFDSHEAAFNSLQQLLTSAIQLVGRDVTCDLFFEGERAFWQGRNRAARVQFMRQAALGMGWGNHDHHTYRSSRVCFAPMIALFEQLGFTCRERFYPGHNAGWVLRYLNTPSALSSSSQMLISQKLNLPAILPISSWPPPQPSEPSACGAACMAKHCSPPACTIWNVSSASTVRDSNWQNWVSTA